MIQRLDIPVVIKYFYVCYGSTIRFLGLAMLIKLVFRL